MSGTPGRIDLTGDCMAMMAAVRRSSIGLLTARAVTETCLLFQDGVFHMELEWTNWPEPDKNAEEWSLLRRLSITPVEEEP